MSTQIKIDVRCTEYYDNDDVYCAAISQIVIGTEPHWYEGNNDG
jgi:hypothetical protein